MQIPYESAPADVKALIISRTKPVVARALCQANRKSREICRVSLSPEIKYRLCLDNSSDAQTCDNIPIFSQQQFQSLVPKQIEIYPEDPVQMTFEFYSQNYKLPTEGFSEALRKAKLINTICAVLRPDFLISDAAKILKIPGYIDVNLLDSVSKRYLTVIKGSLIGKDPFYYIEVSFYNKNGNLVELIVDYQNSKDLPKEFTLTRVDLAAGRISPSDWRDFLHIIINDRFISDLRYRLSDRSRYIGLLSFMSKDRILNVFKISRLIKALFDIGYFHEVKLHIESTSVNSDLITI